jgi:hypothetical protein
MTSPALSAWGWFLGVCLGMVLASPSQGQISITANWQHPILGEQNLGDEIPEGLSAYEIQACNDGAELQSVSERWIVAQVGKQLAVQNGEWIEQAITLYRAKGFWPTIGRIAKRVGSTVAGAGAGVVTMNPLVGLATKEGIDYLADIGKDKEKVVPPSHWWRDTGSTNQQIQPRDCGRPLIVAVADDGKEKVVRIQPLISQSVINDLGKNVNSGPVVKDFLTAGVPYSFYEVGEQAATRGGYDGSPEDRPLPVVSTQQSRGEQPAQIAFSGRAPGDAATEPRNERESTLRTHPMVDEDLERAQQIAEWVRERSAARGAVE